ncbi:hypothetical protein C2845_PM05G19980 [Panicum miliaceum]|uniref:Uncharacterized protein n=1 Tax=Panicum miliaceum TaxID=4540 RepID=A0A3L6SWG2_PANMI|nr:hypothetical protein C2845_PM05G19980 [Panicum miliaceum]
MNRPPARDGGGGDAKLAFTPPCMPRCRPPHLPPGSPQCAGKARRRRVPAFGEWNYYYYSGDLAAPPAVLAASAAEWCAAAAPELEASSDVWFKYSPPPPTSRRKVRRPATEEMYDGMSYGGGKRGLHQHRRAATPAWTSSSDTAVAPPSSVARAPAGKGKPAAGAARARVVRPVDTDLYQVPPPEFLPGDDDEPRRRRRKEAKRKKKKASRRSLWAGCFGFNCVPAE